MATFKNRNNFFTNALEKLGTIKKKIILLTTKVQSAFLQLLFLFSRNSLCVLLHGTSIMDVTKKNSSGTNETLLGNSAYK